MLTVTERQRKFKAKMYDAGFKQSALWIKRETSGKQKGMTRDAFTAKMDKLLSRMDADEQGRLFVLLIKIIEAKKEVLRLRRKK